MYSELISKWHDLELFRNGMISKWFPNDNISEWTWHIRILSQWFIKKKIEIIWYPSWFSNKIITHFLKKGYPTISKCDHKIFLNDIYTIRNDDISKWYQTVWKWYYMEMISTCCTEIWYWIDFKIIWHQEDFKMLLYRSNFEKESTWVFPRVELGRVLWP